MSIIELQDYKNMPSKLKSDLFFLYKRYNDGKFNECPKKDVVGSILDIQMDVGRVETELDYYKKSHRLKAGFWIFLAFLITTPMYMPLITVTIMFIIFIVTLLVVTSVGIDIAGHDVKYKTTPSVYWAMSFFLTVITFCAYFWSDKVSSEDLISVVGLIK